jgi:hypothetical protein
MVLLESYKQVALMKRVIHAHKMEASRRRQQLCLVSRMLEHDLDPNTLQFVLHLQESTRKRLRELTRGYWRCVEKIIYFQRMEQIQISFHEGLRSAHIVHESEIMNKQIGLYYAARAAYTDDDAEWKNE